MEIGKKYTDRGQPQVGDVVHIRYAEAPRGGGNDLTSPIGGGNRVFFRIESGMAPGWQGDILLTGQNKDLGKENLYTGRAYRPSQSSPQTATAPKQAPVAIYHLYIGPTSKADHCAIAICTEEVRKMRPYDALVHVIRQHDNNGIFATSTDRRVAAGLFETYQRAVADNALDELQFTLAGKPVTTATATTLDQYFVLDQGKMRASAVIVEKDNDSVPQEAVATSNDAQESGPMVFKATATGLRKGSPGSHGNNLEQLLMR